MNIATKTAAQNRTILDPEWMRVELLVTMSESLRSGAALSEDFSSRFDEVLKAVMARRESGAWAGLTTVAPEPLLRQFVQLDLDILALALAPQAHPALAPRLHSLQPHIGSPQPSLALVQELLPYRGEKGNLKFPLDQPMPYDLIARVAAALAQQAEQ